MSTSNTAKLTPEFIAALITWQQQGSRSVKIELNTGFFDEESSLNVWIYDYEFTSGEFVTCPEEIPTDRALLLRQKKDVEASRRRLNDQLKALEV